MKRVLLISQVAVLALASQGAAAQDRGRASPPPRVFEEVVQCQKIAAEGERLACFDRTVAQLDAAARAEDLVVSDREQIRAARRGLFGLRLPKVELFDREDDVDEIQSSIAAVAEDASGKWLLTLADGARWRQSDTGFVNRPRAGQSVRVKRGPLGNYMANVEKGRAFRVQRLPD